MTLQQRNAAHRALFARQSDGPGGGGGLFPPFTGPTRSQDPPPGPTDPPAPDPPIPSQSPPPPRPPPAPSSRSSSAPSEPSPPPPPPPPPSTSSTPRPSSSSSSSRSSSSSARSSSSGTTTAAITPSVTLTLPTGDGVNSSFRPVTQTTLPDAASTVTADGIEQTEATKTGPIIGGVVGAIAGLAILGFLIMFLMRRIKRNRRRRAHESDFGNFDRSAFVSDKSAHNTDMVEKGHNVAPSIDSPGAGMAGFGSSAAVPPSQALAAVNASAAAAAANPGGLKERPKYVFGQDPNGEEEDVTNGVYSEQPQMTTAYNPEAYGSYADVGGASGSGYQDAQREYQAQGGAAYDANNGYYDQATYANYEQYAQTGYAQGGYDQTAYAQGYDQNQQAQYYDYSQQQTQEGYQQQQQQQGQEAGYQQPHPYSSSNPATQKTTTDGAYGGM